MNTMREFFTAYFVPVLALIALALALTGYIFRHRIFDRGYRKGGAARPQEVREQNPPDKWSRTH